MSLLSSIKRDIDAIRERDPAARSAAEVVLAYPGFHARELHRMSHALHTRGVPVLPRVISNFSRFVTGIEIHPGAQIGEGLFIDHGMGVVIGETAEIGDDCHILQGVTLGGTSLHRTKRHPTLGNRVVVGAGAKLIGAVEVGDNARIGAGSVVVIERAGERDGRRRSGARRVVPRPGQRHDHASCRTPSGTASTRWSGTSSGSTGACARCRRSSRATASASAKRRATRASRRTCTASARTVRTRMRAIRCPTLPSRRTGGDQRLIQLTNTLTRKLEEFTPQGDAVSMYVCGITPYDESHIGHAMSYVVFDVAEALPDVARLQGQARPELHRHR